MGLSEQIDTATLDGKSMVVIGLSSPLRALGANRENNRRL
jgi:hypothetical protein